ncbi:MAG: DNA repair protein RecN [Chloroflexi bacterium]|nr:DNA repair protein RecN [Chloroflexota bacterium]
MLQELRITNFAIISDIFLEFSSGFNVITGETGAGKSILIDAVNTVLGAQADRSFIRTGAERASVEAVFAIPEHLRPVIKPLLDEEAIDHKSLEMLHLSREIKTNGRNVARINGTVCKLASYREIGSMLIDIHGQSEHLSLLRPREHIYMLDRYAGLEKDRAALAAQVRELQGIRREINKLEQDEAALARRAEILDYQIKEIEAAALKPGEDTELREESNRLANSERLLELTHDAERALFADDVGESGAVELLEEAALTLGKLALLDPAMQELAETAESVSIQAEELADRVRRYGEQIEVSPGQLDSIEERLAAISNLKRKYGGTVEAVLEFLENAKQELEGITHSEERLEELAVQEETLLRQIGESGSALSQKRQEAGQRLGQLIEAELRSLRMEAARFEVRIEQQVDEAGCYVGDERLSFDTTGIDDIEFMLAANFGEPLKPLAKVASGGEASRSMLALKQILSQADQTPTLIFDEIDQGIGGRLGSLLGHKLWQLSSSHQVLCVTHLAQIASFADIHFQVSKSVDEGRTITHVARLDPARRLLELAEMLGSESTSARQNAHDLLNLAWQTKNGQKVEI